MRALVGGPKVVRYLDRTGLLMIVRISFLRPPFRRILDHGGVLVSALTVAACAAKHPAPTGAMDWWRSAEVGVARKSPDGSAFFQGTIPAMRTQQIEPGRTPQILWSLHVPDDYVIDLMGQQSYQACINRLTTPGAACAVMLESNRMWLHVWGPGNAELHVLPGRQPIGAEAGSDWLICQVATDHSTCEHVPISTPRVVP